MKELTEEEKVGRILRMLEDGMPLELWIPRIVEAYQSGDSEFSCMMQECAEHVQRITMSIEEWASLESSLSVACKIHRTKLMDAVVAVCRKPNGGEIMH